MACGEKVVSVFGGAADRSAYLKATGGYKQKPASQKTNRTPETRELETLYARLREIRESKEASRRLSDLATIQKRLDAEFPEDWLLRFELLELDHDLGLGAPWGPTVRKSLTELTKKNREMRELITRGLELFQ